MSDGFFILAPDRPASLAPEAIASVRAIVERATGEDVVVEAHAGFLIEPGGELWDKVTARSTTKRRSSELWFAETVVRHAFVADVGAEVAGLHIGNSLATSARCLVSCEGTAT